MFASSSEASSEGAAPAYAELYVVIETTRGQCIGTTLRCAVAFGATALILVGSDKVSTHGAHGAQNHIRMLHFFYWRDCEVFLSSKKCSIHGIVGNESLLMNHFDPGSFSPYILYKRFLRLKKARTELHKCSRIIIPNIGSFYTYCRKDWNASGSCFNMYKFCYSIFSLNGVC